MKKILGLSFVLCTLLWVAVACSNTTTNPYSAAATPTPSGPTATPNPSVAVTVSYANSYMFNPSTVTITHGQSVYWDSSLNGHTVTMDGFSGTTGSTGTNNTTFPLTINFPTAGTYYYHCSDTNHSGCGSTSYGVCSGGYGMIGTVVVN